MTEKRPFPAATVAGYPRIGANRELKRSLEHYWAQKIDRATFDTQIKKQLDIIISHVK